MAAASGKPAKELKDAKRAGMRVHGRTGETCPECGDVVREVSFADSSLQYCATCQTGGKPLADRRTSKFLKSVPTFPPDPGTFTFAPEPFRCLPEGSGANRFGMLEG